MMTELVPPNQNPVIRKYLKDVLAWHGYIRFLGMPTLQTNPDVPIDELYVAQSLSLENLPTDKQPKPDQLHNPVKLLLEKRHLVILGDPGSGKSTLINWFAWQLASGFVDRLPQELSDLIPVPIVLRELKLENVTTFESLIDAFLERPIAKNLQANRKLLLQYFEAGKVLLLVDGFDEVSLEIREDLRRVFLDYFLRLNSCYSIFTSRKVGYELAPINFSLSAGKEIDSKKVDDKKVKKLSQLALTAVDSLISTIIPLRPLEVYIAPFTDRQISQFSLNWYRENTAGNEDGAVFLRDEFFVSIRSNESTLQLARTPHLLTMMALIFKVRLQLPNGRALLYELIAQAYLESIDTARKLKDPFIWQDKKKWLARIGFEMQLRRINESNDKDSSNELLADKSEILNWLISEMKKTGDYLVDENYAEAYLDWIARRSGLLLPRGEGKFAFLHLSFQEYFSAIYIQQQIENPDYFFSEHSDYLDARFSKKPLYDWSSKLSWHQAFIFLFELISSNRGLLKRIWAECFPARIYQEQHAAIEFRLIDIHLESAYRTPSIDLVLDLLLNPHVLVSENASNESIYELVKLAVFEQECISSLPARVIRIFGDNTILSKLVSTEKMLDNAICNIKPSDKLKFLSVENVSEFVLVSLLDVFSKGESFCGLRAVNCTPLAIKNIVKYNLETLILDESVIYDIEHLSDFSGIRYLSLNGCMLEDISFISKVVGVESLELNYNNINDLSPLVGLSDLSFIALAGNKISDYSVLYDKEKLKQIYCSGLESLEPILKMENLEVISIYNSPAIVDIKPLARLKKIKYVYLGQTGIKESKKYGLRKGIRVYVS